MISFTLARKLFPYTVCGFKPYPPSQGSSVLHTVPDKKICEQPQDLRHILARLNYHQSQSVSLQVPFSRGPHGFFSVALVMGRAADGHISPFQI